MLLTGKLSHSVTLNSYHTHIYHIYELTTVLNVLYSFIFIPTTISGSMLQSVRNRSNQGLEEMHAYNVYVYIYKKLFLC